MKKPIAWTIAGSDSGGGAGIQADIKTFQDLGVHGCTIITAVTSQNTQEIKAIQHIHPDHIATQLSCLKKDLPPSAIKLGMMGNLESINTVRSFLYQFNGYSVLDPVLVATCGDKLVSVNIQDYQLALKKIFPLVDLLTPNLPEAESLLGYSIHSYELIKKAAHDILSLGAKSVLIKGGHFDNNLFSQDYWTNGEESFWLACKKQNKQKYHGAGCTLSAAITAALAKGHGLKDALVIGKMYVTQSIRQAYTLTDGLGLMSHNSWPESQCDLPLLSPTPIENIPEKFQDCGEEPLGIYPIVDRSAWIEKLLPLGIKTIQLRIKEKKGLELENEIKRAIELARFFDVRLFLNDHWDLAIKYGAYGVHLGQEDVETADIEQIRKAKLRLGVSTHGYAEISRAHAIAPSYIACGPIFPTISKIMPFAPLGVEQLKRWQHLLNYPVVAIGGINSDRLPQVLAANPSGVAMISAITEAHDPLLMTQSLIDQFQRLVDPKPSKRF